MINPEKPDQPMTLNIDQIRKFLPHRFPFLLVDRVLEIHPKGDLQSLSSSDKVGTRVVALKCMSFNEPYFQGHFPGFSIVPGVLLLETMAQAASFSIYPFFGKDLERMSKDFQCILLGVDGVRFRKPVIPGDSMRIETEVTKCRGKLWCFHADCFVDGGKVAEADLMANLISHGEI